jgi:hypothetical protein
VYLEINPDQIGHPYTGRLYASSKVSPGLMLFSFLYLETRILALSYFKRRVFAEKNRMRENKERKICVERPLLRPGILSSSTFERFKGGPFAKYPFRE